MSRSSVSFRLVDVDAAFAALPGLTEREAQRRMAEWGASKEPFRYGEAFRVFRFDLPWRPPEADPEAEVPLAEA